MNLTTEEIIKAIEPAWMLFGSMQQRPGARFSVAAEREQLGKAITALHAMKADAEQHPDDAAVDALAAMMKAKLAKQRANGYGGWDTDCTRERLSELLRGHVDKGDPVDVANFCAFLSARGEGIAERQSAGGTTA